LKPLQTSSGDLLADRRADYAEMLFGSGEVSAAAEVMLGALEQAPAWALGWFRLGEMHEAAHALDSAAEAWRMALKLDPADRPGAALKLELIGQTEASSAPPSSFVEALFDQYAPGFDRSLVDKLGYRVPRLLADAIESAAPGRRFPRALDLGCGTGLMGERLRDIADRLEGRDISAAMLKKAEAKGVYDRLVKSDLQTLDLPEESADLITAADVFMYVGALHGIVGRAASWLAPGGLFAFSVEAVDGDAEYALRASRRYAHTETYVRSQLHDRHLRLLSLDHAEIRMDRGEAIAGLIVVATKG